MMVCEYAIIVLLTLPTAGRVEDEINKYSRTLTPTIPSLSIIYIIFTNLDVKPLVKFLYFFNFQVVCSRELKGVVGVSSFALLRDMVA